MEEKVTGLSIDLIIHPGETIKEVLEDREMKQEELAIRTKFSAKHISEVIAGKKDISNSFAVALEYALAIPASFWINLQGIYDKEILELEKEENICSEEKSIIKKLKDITDFCIKNKIIPAINDKKILILNMRKFLQVNDLVDIKKLVIRQSAFRATKEQVDYDILYSWIKICEYYTNDIQLDKKFDKEKLRSNLDKIKKCMFLEVNEMRDKLKEIFSECGIVFEIVKHFTGAPVQGFIKKKDDKIILCMTIRNSFSDIFWFTLFHEIHHILNEDFKDQYVDFYIEQNDIEFKADLFARNYLINEEDYNNFRENCSLTIESVKKFADSQSVKPGIVIGRIQKDTNDFSYLAQYRERYKWIE